MMKMVFDGRYDYTGYFGCTSHCHLRIYVGRGTLPVVIATEVDDNPGTSIINRVEQLYSQVWQKLLAAFPEGLVWVERYPATSSVRTGHRARGAWFDGEHLNLVECELTGGCTVARPTWRPTTREAVEQLVGGPIQGLPEEEVEEGGDTSQISRGERRSRDDAAL